MATILLAGDDAALLEGLAQMLAALGHTPAVVRTLSEARDAAHRLTPLVAVIDRRLVAGAQALGIACAAGGATLLYGGDDTPGSILPATLRRAVLADLTLPLERNRLIALVQRVEARAHAVGRRTRNTPPESPVHR